MNLRSGKPISVSLCLLVFSAAMVLRSEAKGKNVTIDKNDQTTTVECTDNAVTVSGEDNNITLKGECSKLTVTGEDNNILWGTGIGGKSPKITKKGNDVNIVHTGR